MHKGSPEQASRILEFCLQHLRAPIDEKKQLNLAPTDFVKQPKLTRREKFLLEMEAVVSWARLLTVIEPVYPKVGNGRRPYELSTMLRIHFMQQWSRLSADPRQA